MINAARCTVESQRKRLVRSLRVRFCFGFFLVRLGVTVLDSLRGRNRKTLYDDYFQYFSPQVLLKFRRRMKGTVKEAVEILSRRRVISTANFDNVTTPLVINKRTDA